MRGQLLFGAVLALAVAAPAVTAPAAVAAFPGVNGKISFTSQRDGNVDVYVMDPSGSQQTRLTNNGAIDAGARWSPNGQKIAFVSDRDGNSEVYVMNADGTGQVNVTNNPAIDSQPAWSPDGQKIAFVSQRPGDGFSEVYVMNADGTGQVNVTNNPATDSQPAWSPDGQKIAFVSSEGVQSEVHVMNADGSGQVNLTNHPALDGGPAWSPDGQTIAFSSDRIGSGGGGDLDIFAMDANGSGPANVTSDDVFNDAQPAWSPDGQKIAFHSNRDGNNEVYAMDASGTGQVNLTKNSAADEGPDWQPLPTATPSTCGDTILQLNNATVQGPLAETEPGSGVFRAGEGQVVYVGGFELRPFSGGALLVDTNTNSLSEEGTGVQVRFGLFNLPLSVTSIPINVPEATVPLNKDGTLLKALFSLPISGQLKASWTDGGKSAALELELEAEKLVGDFGSFQGAGVTTPALKLQGKQVNCSGFDFTGAEVKADEISFIPKKLKVPKKLGLKNILFRFEDRNGVSFWTGQGELILPTGTGELAVGGKVTIGNSKLAGVGVSTSGINRPIGYGLFLQSVAGELVFEPGFGFNFGVGATFGPKVQGKKLVKLTGNLKGFAQAEDDCKNGRDPIALVGTGSIPLVEELGAGSVKIEGVNCIYTDSLGVEQSPKVEAVFGEVVGGEVPNPVVAAKANLSGFVGVNGFNAEGGGTVTIPIPGLGEISGRVLMSSNAFAACGGVGFFSGGAAHTWGQSRTDTFRGCDLAPWRASASSSGRRARAAARIQVDGDLPFVGFAARGASGAPRVRVSGPRGERFTSAGGKAVVRRKVVMVPVAVERRTFVFIKSPSPGRWRIKAIGNERLTQVRTADGLPDPRVRGRISRKGRKRTLTYRVRRIPGQKITFFERTKDGITRKIGKARRARGRIRFKPVSTGQRAKVEAVVVQNGFPRDTITIARFKARRR